MAQVRQPIYSRSQQIERLREPFNRIAREYQQGYLESDPLKFAHRYSSSRDRELVAFLSAMFAFGNVTSIFQSMEKILTALGEHPSKTITEWPNALLSSLLGFRHRWVNASDLQALLLGLRSVYCEGSLETLFVKGYDSDKKDLSSALSIFSKELRKILTEVTGSQPLSRGLKFLISAPGPGNVMKRMNLFLRWMVRSSSPDLGIWKRISSSQLLLPVDTHLARLVRYTGLTTRKRPVSWRMVSEATENLRELDPKDPIRFDFALSRLGILDRCRHRADATLCPQCPLRQICVLNRGRY